MTDALKTMAWIVPTIGVIMLSLLYFAMVRRGKARLDIHSIAMGIMSWLAFGLAAALLWKS